MGEAEVEGQVELVAAAVVLRHGLRVHDVDLAHGHALVVAVEQPADLAQGTVHVRVVLVVQVTLPAVAVALAPGDQRVVAQGGILQDLVDHVDPEAVHAPVEPEAQHVVHGGHELRVAPVQVRLLDQVRVQVALARGRVGLPRGAAEGREPVVRRRAVGLRVAPHVPVALRALAAAPRRDEPRVLARGVGGHPVEDHPDPPRVGVGEQAIEVLEAAEQGVDVAVVGHVVAEVGLGDGKQGESQRASTPSHERWSRRRRMPSRSPTPSPLASMNERG